MVKRERRKRSVRNEDVDVGEPGHPHSATASSSGNTYYRLTHELVTTDVLRDALQDSNILDQITCRPISNSQFIRQCLLSPNP